MSKRVPYAQPSETDEYEGTTAGRISCDACGEWIYARRIVGSGSPFAFPPDCQVCGAPSPVPPSHESTGK